jgi:hypothetical protein
MRYDQNIRANAEHLNVAVVSISPLKTARSPVSCELIELIDAGFLQPPLISIARAKKDSLSLSRSKVSPVRSSRSLALLFKSTRQGEEKGEDKDDVGK